MQQTGEDDLRNFADKIELQLRNEQHTNNTEPFESQPNNNFESQDIRNDLQQQPGVNNGQYQVALPPTNNQSAPSCSYLPKFLRDRDILTSVVLGLLFIVLTHESVRTAFLNKLPTSFKTADGLQINMLGNIAKFAMLFLLVLIVLKIIKRVV